MDSTVFICEKVENIFLDCFVKCLFSKELNCLADFLNGRGIPFPFKSITNI